MKQKSRKPAEVALDEPQVSVRGLLDPRTQVLEHLFEDAKIAPRSGPWRSEVSAQKSKVWSFDPRRVDFVKENHFCTYVKNSLGPWYYLAVYVSGFCK